MIKQILFTVLGVVSLVSVGLCQPTFCLQFGEVSNDGSTYVVDLLIAGDNAFNLGTSNLQFTYNNSGLDAPRLGSTPLGFGTGYQIPTVTEPEGAGSASFNIELAFVGAGITIGTDFTSVGQVVFDIIDPNVSTDFVWSYNGGTTETVVFINDNATRILAMNNTCLEPLSVPLPVELLSLQAKLLTDKTIQLDWQTATELNNKGFDLERSPDAQRWEKLTFVAGQGNSYGTHTYRWLDKAPFIGTNYYRLRQIDYDGSYTYSSIVQATLTDDGKLEIYPNPTQGDFQVRSTGSVLTKALLQDQQNRTVWTLRNQTPGQSFVVPAEHLPAGIYYLHVQRGTNSWVQQVVIEQEVLFMKAVFWTVAANFFLQIVVKLHWITNSCTNAN